MLVFGGFILRGQDIVTLHLTDDGKAVDLMPAALGGHAAGVIDLLAAALLPGLLRRGLLLVLGGGGRFLR